MYAVIQTGGKQYRVKEGDVLKVETLSADVGSSVDFDKILMVGEGKDVKVKADDLKKAKVSAKVTAHGRGKKIEIIKFKRRKHHEKWQGHRQNFTEVEVTKIQA